MEGETPGRRDRGEPHRPRLVVGWVLGADLRDTALLAAYEAARERLLGVLEDQLPGFRWEMPWVERRLHPPRGALAALPLLELGAEEKLHRHWDYALVVVPNELLPRKRVATVGVPSSALETAVLSSARLGSGEELVDRMVALALHLLGHLFGLDHADSGPMRPFEEPEEMAVEPYPATQLEAVRRQLAESTDARLEEQGRRWGRVAFYWRAFWADPRGIVRDILGSRPWRMPLALGRLTAAAAVSLVYMLLAADSWEVGVALGRRWLVGGPAAAVLLATVAVFWGQNIAQVGREHGWREQLARTHIVLFGTLLLGLASLWVVLFLVSWGTAAVFPEEVFAGWARVPPDELPVEGYAAFMATLGVIAAALGGNLEDEDEIKAELLFDEET